jgi:hypothetical protein
VASGIAALNRRVHPLATTRRGAMNETEIPAKTHWPVHPIALLFPAKPPQERAELKRDMQERVARGLDPLECAPVKLSAARRLRPCGTPATSAVEPSQVRSSGISDQWTWMRHIVGCLVLYFANRLDIYTSSETVCLTFSLFQPPP